MQVGQVVGIGRASEHLVEDREEVGERADGAEGNGVFGTEGAAGRGDDEGDLDGLERDPARGERAGEESIVAGSAARGTGQGVIGGEHGADVVV
jgi:hypothetical protein